VNTQETTTNYVELTSQAFGLVLDAFASGSKRALDYTKAAWEITTQPYPSLLIDSVVKENINRANRLANLAVGELQAAGLESGDFVEKVLEQSTKIQGTALRGLLDTYASRLNDMQDITTQQPGDLSKRLEELKDQKAAAGSR
jgi:hypothetical protein